MIDDPKKAGAAVLIAMGKAKPKEHEEPEEGGYERLVVHASALISALHGKDAQALTNALCGFIDEYEAQPHDEYEG
jgi:hypothetical protein